MSLIDWKQKNKINVVCQRDFYLLMNIWWDSIRSNYLKNEKISDELLQNLPFPSNGKYNETCVLLLRIGNTFWNRSKKWKENGNNSSGFERRKIRFRRESQACKYVRNKISHVDFAVFTAIAEHTCWSATPVAESASRKYLQLQTTICVRTILNLFAAFVWRGLHKWDKTDKCDVWLKLFIHKCR